MKYLIFILISLAPIWLFADEYSQVDNRQESIDTTPISPPSTPATSQSRDDVVTPQVTPGLTPIQQDVISTTTPQELVITRSVELIPTWTMILLLTVWNIILTIILTHIYVQKKQGTEL